MRVACWETDFLMPPWETWLASLQQVLCCLQDVQTRPQPFVKTVMKFGIRCLDLKREPFDIIYKKHASYWGKHAACPAVAVSRIPGTARFWRLHLRLHIAFSYFLWIPVGCALMQRLRLWGNLHQNQAEPAACIYVTLLPGITRKSVFNFTVVI